MKQYGNYIRTYEKPEMRLVMDIIGASMDEVMERYGLDVFTAEKIELKMNYHEPYTLYSEPEGLNTGPLWDIGWVATFKEEQHEKAD